MAHKEPTHTGTEKEKEKLLLQGDCTLTIGRDLLTQILALLASLKNPVFLKSFQPQHRSWFLYGHR
jgi:hypothetical protein